MKLTVWKYPLQKGMNTVGIPQDGKPLSVGFDHLGKLSVWVLIDEEKPKRDRRFWVGFTGQQIDDMVATTILPEAHFVGTVIGTTRNRIDSHTVHEIPEVLHVFIENWFDV